MTASLEIYRSCVSSHLSIADTPTKGFWRHLLVKIKVNKFMFRASITLEVGGIKIQGFGSLSEFDAKVNGHIPDRLVSHVTSNNFSSRISKIYKSLYLENRDLQI